MNKLSIRTCVFLIGLLPNLINCENVVGGMARPSGASGESLRLPSELPSLKLLTGVTIFTNILLL